MYAVDICDAGEVDGLREAWNELVARCALPTPFLGWEWITTWRDHFGAADGLTVLRVRENGQLRGLLPLKRGAAFFVAPALTFAGAEHVGADHLDVIATPKHSARCLGAIAEFLRSGGLDWRELRLPLLAQDSRLLDFARRQAGLRIALCRSSSAPYIEIEGDYGRFLSGLSGRARHKLRQRTRQLIDRRGARYCAYGPDRTGVALETLFALHRQRASARNLRSTFATRAGERFHSALARKLPADQLVLRGLEVDDRTIAMFYGFRCADRLFYFQLGHDPAWADWSPGMVMITKTVEEACESGCVEYNFLQGDEPFKRIWTKRARDLYDATLYSSSVTGRAAREAHRFARSVRNVLKSGMAALTTSRRADGESRRRPDAGGRHIID